MIPNWNKILKEWSYRVGVIKPNNSRHLYHLNKILEERGWPYEVIHEIIENLNNQIKQATDALNTKFKMTDAEQTYADAMQAEIDDRRTADNFITKWKNEKQINT